MATELAKEQQHDLLLKRIDEAMEADLWEEKFAVIEIVQGLLRDLPTERTIERLVDILDRLAQDTKWEVRKAVVPALVDVRRPGARKVIDRLTDDSNRWARQTAERAKRKLGRITTPAEKRDKQANFAFEIVKDLEGGSSEKIYEAARCASSSPPAAPRGCARTCACSRR